MARSRTDGPAPIRSMLTDEGGGVLSGTLWMLLISLLLFWLPVVGPLIAGVIGGRSAGSVGAAIVAVFLPALVAAGLLFVLGTSLSGVPLIGAVAGAGAFALAAAHVGPLLVGALIGGLFA